MRGQKSQEAACSSSLRSAESSGFLLLITCCVWSAKPLTSPSEEDMGTSVLVCRSLSIRAPGGTRIPCVTSIVPQSAGTPWEAAGWGQGLDWLVGSLVLPGTFKSGVLLEESLSLNVRA